MHQMQGSAVGYQEAVIAYDTTGAAAGIPIVTLPAGSRLLGYHRETAYTGGSSPNLAIGTTATGTEVVASGGTSAATLKAFAVDTTIYASLTGSPTGGSGKVGVSFAYPS